MKFFWLIPFITPLTHAATLDEARVALEDGFPLVALVKIEESVPNIGTPGSDADANLLYARALIESGQSGAAVTLLENSKFPRSSEGNFWLAQALAANGDFSKALECYASASRDTGFAFYREAIMGKARMQKNLSNLEEAASTLTPAISWPTSPTRALALLDLAEIWIDQKKPESARACLDGLQTASADQTSRRSFLLALIAVQEGNDDMALNLFSTVVPTNAGMAVSRVVHRAKALRRLLREAEAETLLEEFVAEYPTLPGLQEVFAQLDETYAAATNPSSSELKRWSSEADSALRQKLATYYLARFETRQLSPEAALPLLERLAADPSSNPLAHETLLELAALRVRLGMNDEALALLPPTGSSSHTDFLRGLALARKGDHDAAAVSFASAAVDSELTEAALFNASISELFAGHLPNSSLLQLEMKFPASPRIAAYRMQEAFHLARNGDPQAHQRLERLASSPAAGIAFRARLALAEWKYQQLDYQGADAELQRISTHPDPTREAALKVFLADRGDSSGADAAIGAARAFLGTYQNSESEPSVRMKLGELLYRRGDFASARVELEMLARNFPNSEYNEAALFLAAQSVSRIPTPTAPDEAILLYEEVAIGNGTLAAQSRLEQASLLASQGKPLEANLVLDKLRSSNPPPAMQATALIEKGKNLYSLGGEDPANYRAAIDVWKQIAAEHSTNPTWRNEALTRIGIALEKTGDLNAASATYYDVFKPEATAPTEFFWFYKAGFAAARIFESTQKWPEAIRVYETLAATDGPRAVEAKNRIKQLRLEHFIWDGN